MVDLLRVLVCGCVSWDVFECVLFVFGCVHVYALMLRKLERLGYTQA